MLIVILYKKTLSQGGLFLQKNIIINHHQKDNSDIKIYDLLQ
jgi:hypothetical protein